MRISRLRYVPLSTLAVCLLSILAGCRHRGDGFNAARNPAAWNASKSSARQELSDIPQPSKNAYMAIRREPQWQNPFLSVGRNMIQVRIFLADDNDSQLDRGGLTRTSAARRQVLNVRLADLPRALASLPNDVWPYGRVVAVGEGLSDAQDRAQVRRNWEATVDALNDLGVVVHEWNGPGLTQ
ncbi:MAG: hypothetical protein ACYDC6_10705 [Acidobacteriaceae bacterium]